MDHPFSGVFPVFQTPFDQQEEIDYPTFDREVEWLLDQGANGIVMGMVSEVLRLSCEERMQLAERCCQRVGDRGKVIISVGAESSHTAATFARHAESAGADALMAIPPVATASTEMDLLDYFCRLVESVQIPVIVQDASGYVGQSMSLRFQVALLEQFGVERIWFKPEAPPIGSRLTKLRDETLGQAIVFEGTGGAGLIDSFKRGIIGTIPGADLIRGIVAIWDALQRGDITTASRIHGPISALISLQPSLDAFLAVEKHLLVRQGVLQNEIVRGPRGFEMDEETCCEVDRLFDLMIEEIEK